MNKMIIENIKNYKSYNCFSGSISFLLECKDVHLPEFFSFGLSKGLNFEINRLEDNTLSFKAVRSLHCLTDFIYSMGVKVLEHPYEDLTKTNQLLIKTVNSNLPFVFEYDGYYFPFTQIFNQVHEKRIAVVVGYDDEYIYVSDFIYGAYVAPIAKEVFWNGIFSNGAKDVARLWYDVQYPEDINDKIEENLIIDAIIEVTNHFFKEEDGYSGLIGLKKFGEDISELLSYFNNLESKEVLGEISEDLKQMTMTLGHFGLFLDYIVEKKLIKTPQTINFKVTAQHFQSASQSWRIVCSLILKLTYRYNDNTVEKIANNIGDTYEALFKGFSELKRIEYGG